MPGRRGPGNQQHGNDDAHREQPEERPPAQQRQKVLHGQRRCHETERADHQHPRVATQLQRGLEPAPIASQRRHEAGTHTDAGQHARGQQHRELGRDRKQQAAGHGCRQEGDDHTLGPITIEPCAHRQLRQRESKEVATRKQAKVARLQVELRRQRRRQRGGDRAHQRRKKVGKGEGEKHRREAASARQDAAHGKRKPSKKTATASVRKAGRAPLPGRATPPSVGALLREPDHVRLAAEAAASVLWASSRAGAGESTLAAARTAASTRVSPASRSRVAARQARIHVSACSALSADACATANVAPPASQPVMSTVIGLVGKRERARRAIGLARHERDEARVGDRNFSPVEGGAAGGESGGAQDGRGNARRNVSGMGSPIIEPPGKASSTSGFTCSPSRRIRAYGTKIAATRFVCSP